MWWVSASHIPVLTLLSIIYSPKRILEVGIGNFSTLTFLNSVVFPTLEKLTAVETDYDWIDKIAEKLTPEQKQKTLFILGIPDNLDLYDIIFIDGPQDVHQRMKNIERVTYGDPQSMIVIHDIENKSYLDSVNPKLFRYIFNFSSPKTGIFYSKPLPDFTEYDNLFKLNFDQTKDNGQEWRDIITKFNSEK